MSDFCHDMLATLGLPLVDSGFRPTPPLISEGDYCVFVKRYSESIGLYVVCTDNRAKGGNVVITLWIAPIEFPDDRITALNIGIKMIIFSSYQISDTLVTAAGNKILAVVKGISDLAKVVENDIKQPFIENKRIRWFCYSREIYTVLSRCEEAQDEFTKLQTMAQKCISGKLSFKKLEAECMQLFSVISSNMFSQEVSSLTLEDKVDLFVHTLYAEMLFI